MSTVLPDFLPGRLVIERGSPCDYRGLEQYHYRSRSPRTWAQVWVVRYKGSGVRGEGSEGGKGSGDRGEGSERNPVPSEWLSLTPDPSPLTPPPIAIGVLSWPVAFVKQRNDHFGLSRARVSERLRFANAHIRTISRIVVHPQFQSIGLASILVRHLCAHCPTRYVEALAVMGRVHPMFERAGMTRFAPTRDDGPVYYLFDRSPDAPAARSEL